MGVGRTNPEKVKFDALYNEEMKFLANKGSDYRLNYPRHGRNQGWGRLEGWND